MAVIRNTSSQRRVGRVGSDTYYVAGGQQIVRQAQNNSNFGVSASRTEAQQKRRVRWANLVNSYKQCSSWMPGCFENRKAGESYYNKFMSLNLSDAVVCLTKDMAASGCCVLDNFIVSQGSLSPISLSIVDGTIVTSLKVPLYENVTTVGDLATQIIGSNIGWDDGDGIGLIAFNARIPGSGYPTFSTIYDEIVLDTRDVNGISSKDGLFTFTFVNNFLALESYPDWHEVDDDWAVVLIHTRKSNRIQVSTQRIEVGNESLQQVYSSVPWEAECIKSYGMTEQYIITPTSMIAKLRRYKVGNEDWFIVRGNISRTVPVETFVFFDVISGTDASFKITLNNRPQELDRQDGYYVLDTSTAGTYNIYVNGELAGTITAVGG